MQKKKIAIIFGGKSSEHKISKISAQYIASNVDTSKYELILIGISQTGDWLLFTGNVADMSNADLNAANAQNLLQATGATPAENFADSMQIIENPFSLIKSIDVVFPVLHGCMGEDGTIQGMFEIAEVPYVGAGVLASALCMDKAYSKIVFEKAGLPQCGHIVFSRKEILDNAELQADKAEAKIGYPCFVKPSNAGSSVGVTKAHDRKELVEGLKTAAKFDIRVLVEEFIDGREAECAILGNDLPIASIVGEIKPGNEFYDYGAKYVDDNSDIVIPGDFPSEISEKIRDYAIRAYKAADCSGLSRVDFFVHKKTGEIYINEINTMPGFTSISMYPKLWEASGIPCGELIERLLDLAVERFDRTRRELDA